MLNSVSGRQFHETGQFHEIEKFHHFNGIRMEIIRKTGKEI